MIKNYFKPILAALIMGSVVYALNGYNLIAVIFIGAIIYGAAIFILGTFNPPELLILKNLIKRPPESTVSLQSK